MKRKINILKGDTYWHHFSSYLNELGYDCRVIDVPLPSVESFVQKHTEDLNIIWSGFFRKKTDNNLVYVNNPSVAWAEQGCGLAHYDTISLDPKGHLGLGTIPDSLSVPNVDIFHQLDKPNLGLTEEEDAELTSWMNAHYFNIEKCDIPNIPERFIFFPLQHLRDSTMMFDCPAWCRDYNKIITEIVPQLSPSQKLVVKQHPKHSQNLHMDYGDKVVYIPRIPESMNAYYNSQLLSKCDSMIAVNSSIVVEALAYNKPVRTMGNGVFTGNYVTKEIENLNSIFDGNFTNITQNRKFLYTVCIERQILKEDCSNIDIVNKFWSKFVSLYDTLYS